MKPKLCTCLTLLMTFVLLTACNAATNDEQMKQDTVVLIDLTRKETSDSNAVEIHENQLTIKTAGTYQIYGTLANGSIIVDAKKDSQVNIFFAGASISCSNHAPLYIKKAGSITITLPDNSKNELTNCGEYATIDDNNVDAVLFSKSDLVINGNGELTVTSEYGNGITGKDNVFIKSGNIVIDVSGHALEANDSITIDGGSLSLAAGKDAIHTENDEDTGLGIFTMNGGSVSISAEDDAIHAVASLTVNNGTLNIEKCLEGLEAAKIYIKGGNVFMNASDDGINATVGAKVNCHNGEAIIHISGGKTEIITKGGALDSNGDILMDGGDVLIHGPGTSIFGFGSLDYVNKAEINGGLFVAFTVGGKVFSDTSTQAAFNLNLSSRVSKGTKVVLTDPGGNAIFSERAAASFDCLIVSSPKLAVGERYSVNMGNTAVQVYQRNLITKTNK